MSKCCFERLDIGRCSSERDIKTAYRRLALATHPDKFSDPKDKEGATTAFRELHEAYEQAMQLAGVKSPPARGARQNAAPKAPSPKEATEPPRQHSKPKAPSREKSKAAPDDADIRQAFNDVCHELDRERLERVNQSEIEFVQVVVPLVAATWPNREECWKAVEKATVLNSEIQDLVNHFKTSVPLLSLFLEQQVALRSAQRRARYAAENHERARYVDQNWPAKADHVKAWANKEWTSMHYPNVAKLVRDPMASRAILQWGEERSAAFARRFKAKIRESANEIVRVFPDRAKIVGILDRHFRFNRPKIYALLPEDIRGGVDDLFDDKAAICAPKVGRSPTTSGNAGRAEDASEDRRRTDASVGPQPFCPPWRWLSDWLVLPAACRIR